MDFVKYQHVERIGMCGNELDGLLNGTVWVFPKIDGSNHCVYWDKDLDRVAIASRNQLLSKGYDTTKFWHFANEHKGLEKFVSDHKNLRIYGEYLTPHTIRTYKDSAWNRYYIFDVWDDTKERWLDYDQIVAVGNLIQNYGYDDDIQVIPAICQLQDPTVDDLLREMDSDVFLLQEGAQGEGIVVKNYDYVNPYGRRTWGKIVREDFKVKMKSPNKGEKVELPEEKAVRETLTEEFVSKEYHKFTTDAGVVWNMKMTPDFLKYIWREWWVDCSFIALADLKAVDMKAVRKTVASQTMRMLSRITIKN